MKFLFLWIICLILSSYKAIGSRNLSVSNNYNIVKAPEDSVSVMKGKDPKHQLFFLLLELKLVNDINSYNIHLSLISGIQVCFWNHFYKVTTASISCYIDIYSQYYQMPDYKQKLS